MADRCIIGDVVAVRKIIAALHLPKDTEPMSDSHYRCAKCLGAADAEVNCGCQRTIWTTHITEPIGVPFINSKLESRTHATEFNGDWRHLCYAHPDA